MMRGSRIAGFLMCGTFLSACEVERVQAPALQPSFSAEAGVSASATGSGHFIVNGELRKFSFAAISHGNGEVTGKFELVAGNADLVAHGSVICMTVIENQAWIAGTIDRNSIGAPFTHGWWRAVDHAGTGGADQISVLVVANNPAGNLALAFCENTPEEFPPLNTVTAGNISVR
jgi:hypothetical protein